jgi:fluoroacetyl-CoA thioesterase
MTVRVRAEVTAVQGRKVSFRAVAHDEFDCIAEGTHERHVVDAARFNAKVAEKTARMGRGPSSS